jgi:spore coat protein CotH
MWDDAGAKKERKKLRNLVCIALVKIGQVVQSAKWKRLADRAEGYNVLCKHLDVRYVALRGGLLSAEYTR